MILVDSLLYKIDLKLNKLASNTHQSIPLEDKIIALNEAQIKLIKQKLTYNNNYKLGLDSFKKRYEDLQTLVITSESLSISKETADLSKLKSKYMFYIDSYLLADKGECKSKKINVRLVKHSDVQTLLNNNHYKPSFEYQETLATISGTKLEIYTNDTFEPKKAYISYIRYPNKIDKEGYVDFDGSESKNADCELPNFLEDELVDIAVQELAFSTENVPAAQFTEQRIQHNE
jgi:hypothetical protein